MERSKKVFSLNVIKNRVENLKLIIPIILKQCDLLYVNCIGHKINTKDEGLNFLENEKIILEHLSSGGSETRFLHYNKHPNDTYYFTIDDDILYPDNYADELILKMEKYQNKGLCCVHGSILNLTLEKDFYKKRKQLFHFRYELKEDEPVTIPGVGTTCFYTPNFKLNIDDFKTKNMSDPYVASFAHKQGVKVFSIKRDKNWLTPLNEYGSRIYGNNPHREIDALIIKTFKQ